MKKLYSTAVLMVMAVWGIFAQQEAQYTQYMYNTQAVNPAYAGSRGLLSMAALYRAQWTGLDGAPTTQSFTASSPVSERVGLGLSVINDEIGNGTNQNTYFDVDFSYTVPIFDTGKLSFGLKAGGHMLNIDLNKLRNYNPGLLAVEDIGVDRKFSPNFGTGIYYHTDRFYVGASVPNILTTEHFETSEGSTTYLVGRKMPYYFISGVVMDLNYQWKFKPALLVRATTGGPVNVDLSANFLFNEKLSLGAAYRLDAAISALVGFQISDRFMLGMAYDRETTELAGLQFNDGSFEFFLRYEIFSRYRRVVKPRFF